MIIINAGRMIHVVRIATKTIRFLIFNYNNNDNNNKFKCGAEPDLRPPGAAKLTEKTIWVVDIPLAATPTKAIAIYAEF